MQFFKLNKSIDMSVWLVFKETARLQESALRVRIRLLLLVAVLLDYIRSCFMFNET